jgi:DNA-binding response OmpR family regulator
MPTHPEAGTAAVVEDDRRLAQQIEDILGLAGWKTQRFSRGQDFLARQQRAAFDVALIDMRLPDLTGIELLERLSTSTPAADGRHTASLVVTGLIDEGNLEKAFALGAEDYVLKPFRARELIARIGAAHRRRLSAAAMTGADPENAAPHTVGCFRISPKLRQIARHGIPVALTDKEFDAALLFFSRTGQTVSREELRRRVWQTAPQVETRTIDTHVSRLRRKLQLTTDQGFRLAPVYGQGYRLDTLTPHPEVST